MGHDRDNGDNISTKLTFFLVGAGIGAVLALLFAPKSGEELRNDIADATRKGIDRSRDAAQQLGAKATEYYDTGRAKVGEYYDSAKETAEEYYEATRERATELYDTATAKAGSNGTPRHRSLSSTLSWLTVSIVFTDSSSRLTELNTRSSSRASYRGKILFKLQGPLWMPIPASPWTASKFCRAKSILIGPPPCAS